MTDPRLPDDSRETLTLGWSLIRALHHDEVDTADAMFDEFGDQACRFGTALVALRLIRSLRSHADAHGCDCGSDEWLDRIVLSAASGENL